MKAKAVLLSGICAVALSTSAMAADLPMPTKAPPVPVPQFSWSGCYVGGNLGYGHESRDWNGTATVTPSTFLTQKTSGSGFVGGGQLGCNYQAGNWVFGIEGMVDGSTINQSNAVAAIPGALLIDKITSFETLTGRLGWAVDRGLIYIKGGAAWDQTSGTINGSAVGAAGQSETHTLDNTGWVVGAGLAYAFAPQWSVRVEYDYMGFTNRTVQYPITTTGPVEFTNQNLQTILAGVDYRFSGP
jgi:outer membrane immunogenic protein